MLVPKLPAAVVVVAVLGSTAPAVGQGARNVEITTTKVAANVYMLEGQGGNIGVCTGPDGVFMVDDQFAPMTGKIKAAIAELTDEPVRFVINTHWHGDHTGGNENFGETGSIIVAHENVRNRMSVEQFMEAFGRRVPASPPSALPVITFPETVDFHLNGDRIHVMHLPNAHTDGDSLIHFEKADVLHLGDVFFNGMYPFIDVSSGGSIDGLIRAVDRCLRRCGAATQIIPGHGPLAKPEDLRRYREMLQTVRDSVAKLKAGGSTRDAAIAAKPTASLDERWGGGFMQPDVFVGLVYDSLP